MENISTEINTSNLEELLNSLKSDLIEAEAFLMKKKKNEVLEESNKDFHLLLKNFNEFIEPADLRLSDESKQIVLKKAAITQSINSSIEKLKSKMTQRSVLKGSLAKMKEMEGEYKKSNNELENEINQLRIEKALLEESLKAQVEEGNALEVSNESKMEKISTELDKLDLTELKGNVLNNKRKKLQQKRQNLLAKIKEATGINL